MLVRAAIALDGRTVSEGISAALDGRGVTWTWENLVRPVFDQVCRRQARTGAAIEVEHLFSDRLLAALQPLTEQPRDPVNSRPVLLACAEEEQHSLPVYALAATLSREHRVTTRVLGARTPYSALNDAVRRVGPTAIFLWSQTSETGDPARLRAIPAVRPPASVVVGGPGWPDALPSGTARVTALGEAVEMLLRLLG